MKSICLRNHPACGDSKNIHFYEVITRLANENTSGRAYKMPHWQGRFIKSIPSTTSLTLIKSSSKINIIEVHSSVHSEKPAQVESPPSVMSSEEGISTPPKPVSLVFYLHCSNQWLPYPLSRSHALVLTPQSIWCMPSINMDVPLFSICGMNKYFISYYFRDSDSHDPGNRTCCLHQQKLLRLMVSLSLDLVKCMGNNPFLHLPLALQTFSQSFP